jgi:CDP-glucose 4,6-dehydratase
MVMIESFWKNRRVFITGHTGFKGSWLALWCLLKGAKVFGYSLAPQQEPCLYDLLNYKDKFTSTYGDIRDLKLLKQSLYKAEPEIIIHLAAQSLVLKSYKDPLETYSTNAMGTVHLLEACREVDSVQAVVNVTTDKCYENQESLWGYREIDRLGGYDPYSNSKACSELVSQSYYNSFFKTNDVGLATARAGNVIGGGDWAENRLIPDIVRALFKKERFFIRSPKAVRPWQHVLEPLSGYLLLAEKLYNFPDKYSGAWNFGPLPYEAKNVEEVTGLVFQMFGLDKDEFDVSQETGKYHETNMLYLDISKAQKELGWHPKIDLRSSLALTVSWYQRATCVKNKLNIMKRCCQRLRFL